MLFRKSKCKRRQPKCVPLVSTFSKFSSCFFEDLHDAFVLFDVNHDGRITESELNSVLNFLGIKASPSDVKKMIADADIDGNGTVEYNEFIRMMNRYSEKAANCPDAEMLEAFRVFDHNNDSYIDHDEIKRTMHFLGETVSDEEVRAMIQEADTDHDGLVDFEGWSPYMPVFICFQDLNQSGCVITQPVFVHFFNGKIVVQSEDDSF
ncbi:unnamed protein product [Mesocestoides corti]|uniref:Calmodulin n=1 Tax=Mesocestoides corti TaxID=53468 RepID=A0A0R3UI07_MESCO|nr:unnamed protein product [Mesocestoides corti]